MIEKLRNWRPDKFVREPAEFSGIIVAQKLGIRHVRLEILNGESEETIATNYHAQYDALRCDVSLPPVGNGYLKGEPAYSGQ